MNIPGLLVRRGISAVLLGLALLATASPGAAAGSLPANPSTQWVMGYYVGYQETLLPPASVAWSDLTHIIMSPMTANADGTLNTDFDASLGDGPALAMDIATHAHAAGKKALLMLGGAGNGAAIANAAMPAHRAAFVQNLLSAMGRLGYDGIDLDWEDSIDWANFQAFVTALRTAAPSAILTIPVNTININFDTVDPHLAAIAAQVDRIDVMTYYPATAFAGSGWFSWFGSPLKGEKGNTPISVESSMGHYLAAGVPRQKLGMGIAFYAICYTGGITGPNQSTEGGVTIQGGDNEFPLSELYGATGEYFQIYHRWNHAAAEPFMTLKTPERHGCRYVSYEDEASILAKGLFSRMHNYGGIIIWTLAQGRVASHPNPDFLMDALYKGFVDPDLPTPVAVSVLQGHPSVPPHHGMRFSALVTGTENKDVTWSIPTAACGTINASGFYIAAGKKTCTVKATSVADPTKFATMNVTVANPP